MPMFDIWSHTFCKYNCITFHTNRYSNPENKIKFLNIAPKQYTSFNTYYFLWKMYCTDFDHMNLFKHCFV